SGAAGTPDSMTSAAAFEPDPEPEHEPEPDPDPEPESPDPPALKYCWFASLLNASVAAGSPASSQSVGASKYTNAAMSGNWLFIASPAFRIHWGLPPPSDTVADSATMIGFEGAYCL